MEDHIAFAETLLRDPGVLSEGTEFRALGLLDAVALIRDEQPGVRRPAR